MNVRGGSIISPYSGSTYEFSNSLIQKVWASWAHFNSLDRFVEALFVGLLFFSACLGHLLGLFLLLSWAS